MADGGDVFVLDMGKPVRICDLARRMIHLMGLTVRDEDHPDGDIEISYTGLRPAEKLYEELLIGNNITGTQHPMILRAIEHSWPWERVHGMLDEILAAWDEFQKCGKTVADQDKVFLANPFTDVAQNPELRLDFRFHHPARLMASSAIKQSKHPVVRLGEICAERNESYVPSVDFPDQFIYYTGLAQMESRTGNATQIYVPAQSLKSGVKKFYRHDILFARMRPNLRKCHFAEFTHDGYTSSECIVLTVRKDNDGQPVFDPFLLSVLLRSDFVYGQIMHQVAGIGRPRLAAKDFKHILVPLPSPKTQSALRDSFLKARLLYKELEEEARHRFQQAEAMKIQAVENIARSLCGIPVSYRSA
jgi:type I restriction enzyme M protein